MKKCFLSMMTLAAMLFVSSCSNEELVSDVNGDKATISFKLNVENGVQSRATISDGTKADKLIYAVFDEEGNRLNGIPQAVETGVSFPKTVNITLAKGQKYYVVFWAQDADCNAYTVSNEMNVIIDYDTGVNNDETRDAFFCSKEIEVTDNAESKLEEQIVLKRPFAQLNVGTTEEDWNAAVASGKTILESEVTISNVADEINLLDGSVKGSKEITYSYASIPTELLKIDLDKDGVRETTYKYLSMSYLLVDDATSGSNKALVTSLDFNFKPEKYNVINFSKGLTGVPVQRNWRTNIIGKILTSDVDFNISIEPTYEDDYAIDGTITSETTKDELKTMLEAGGSVRVAEAITTPIDFSALNISDDLELTIAAPVSELILGGNNSSTSAKARTANPNITIEIVKDIAYPAITLKNNVRNYTIKGNVATSKPMNINFTLDNAHIQNFVLDGIKATDGVLLHFLGAQDITIQNCVAENLTKTFISLSKCNNAQILNNTISYQTLSTIQDENHGINTFESSGNILVEGNKVSNANKHGLMVNWGNDAKVVVRNNIFDGAGEDAIKADYSRYIEIYGNTIKASEYGVRLDRLHEGTATFVIEENEVSTPCNNDAYGILINNRDKKTVTVELTAKNNTIGEGGIKRDCYFKTQGEGMTLTGDYEMPFNVIDGVGLTVNGEIGISNLNGLQWLADVVNGKIQNNVVDNNHSGDQGSFEGQTVKLLSDINMGSISNWTPIGNSNEIINRRFAGTFDGNNKTISNLTVNNTDLFAVGLFGYSVGTFKNVILKNVNITGAKCVGAIAGALINDVVENCHVDGGSITGTGTENVGGIAGLANDSKSNGLYKLCSVKNLTITSGNNVGGIIGAGDATLSENTVDNVTVVADHRNKTIDETRIGEFVGWNLGATVNNDNNFNNSTLKIMSDGITMINKEAEIYNANGLVFANKNLFAKTGYSYKLTDNIDMQDVDWTPAIVDKTVVFTFDGNGKTISNWATSANALLAPKNNNSMTIKNLILSNCSVQNETAGGSDGVGLLIGFSEQQDNITLEKITVNNCTINTQANWTGGLIGYNSQANNLTISDCAINNITINGNGSVGGIIGHDAGNNTVISRCAVGNSSKFISTETDDWRVGAVAGTVGAGATAFNDNTIGKNTYTQTNASGNENIYGNNDTWKYVFGRLAGGTLTINGVEVK